MKFSALSVIAISLATTALAAPAARWRRDAPGPSGTLQLPQGNADWDNTSGFGVGHVVYQGVDQDYYNSEGVVHVTTHHIDVFLEAQDGSGDTYYLAKGIAPDSNLVFDEQFQIPIAYGGPLGQYRLVIEETQLGVTPGFPIPITFRAAAPLISVTASPLP